MINKNFSLLLFVEAFTIIVITLSSSSTSSVYAFNIGSDQIKIRTYTNSRTCSGSYETAFFSLGKCGLLNQTTVSEPNNVQYINFTKCDADSGWRYQIFGSINKSFSPPACQGFEAAIAPPPGKGNGFCLGLGTTMSMDVSCGAGSVSSMFSMMLIVLMMMMFLILF